MFCYKCGNQLEDDAVFCPFCGAKNDDEENQPSVKVNDNYYAPPRAKKSVPWKLIISSAVIAAAVILVFAFGRNPDKVKFGNEMLETSMTGKLDLGLLELTNADIVNLKYMTNITELRLRGNNISDISPLSKLTNLEVLYLDATSISDISPLAKLTNLKVLHITDTNISDISPLSKLTNLEMLDLQSNNISDISALSELTGLNSVRLTNNSISDLTPLSRCKLSLLVASNNPLNGNLQAFRGLDFTGDNDSKFYIDGCGYEQYFLTNSSGEYTTVNDEFQQFFIDNIKINDKLDLCIYDDGTFGGMVHIQITNN